MPLALTDSQLLTVMAAAAPLDPEARVKFLQAVADELMNREIGDGIVSRVARDLQGRFRPRLVAIDGTI
jgi:hypothetical protein